MTKWLLPLIFLLGCDTTPRQVVYKIGGTATEVSITYSNSQGGTAQLVADVPWSTSFDAGRGHFVYVSAQNQGKEGTVVATITVDGNSFKTTQSEGAYRIATASGSVP